MVRGSALFGTFESPTERNERISGPDSPACPAAYCQIRICCCPSWREPAGRSASSAHPPPLRSYRTLHWQHTHTHTHVFTPNIVGLLRSCQAGRLNQHEAFERMRSKSRQAWSPGPDEKSEEGLLQVFPGDVRVPGGPGPRRGPAQSEDVRSEGGQSLGAEVGVDEVQVSPHDHHGGVGSSGLQRERGPFTMRSRKSDTAVLVGGGDGRSTPLPRGPRQVQRVCWVSSGS